MSTLYREHGSAPVMQCSRQRHGGRGECVDREGCFGVGDRQTGLHGTTAGMSARPRQHSTHADCADRRQSTPTSASQRQRSTAPCCWAWTHQHRTGIHTVQGQGQGQGWDWMYSIQVIRKFLLDTYWYFMNVMSMAQCFLWKLFAKFLGLIWKIPQLAAAKLSKFHSSPWPYICE